MTIESNQVRPLDLTDEVRLLLFRLRLLSNVNVEPKINSQQLVEIESHLNCSFPDSIIAVFANGDDATCEQFGVRLEDVVDNTILARELGYPNDKVAIGCHPDDQCFYCISTNAGDSGITVFDKLDGSSKFLSLAEWLSEIAELEIDIKEANPIVDQIEFDAFVPSII